MSQNRSTERYLKSARRAIDSAAKHEFADYAYSDIELEALHRLSLADRGAALDEVIAAASPMHPKRPGQAAAAVAVARLLPAMNRSQLRAAKSTLQAQVAATERPHLTVGNEILSAMHLRLRAGDYQGNAKLIALLVLKAALKNPQHTQGQIERYRTASPTPSAVYAEARALCERYAIAS